MTNHLAYPSFPAFSPSGNREDRKLFVKSYLSSETLSQGQITASGRFPHLVLGLQYKEFPQTLRDDFQEIILELLVDLAKPTSLVTSAYGDELILLAEDIFVTSARASDAIDALLDVVQTDSQNHGADKELRLRALGALLTLRYRGVPGFWLQQYENGEDAFALVTFEGLAGIDPSSALEWASSLTNPLLMANVLYECVPGLINDFGLPTMAPYLRKIWAVLPNTGRDALREALNNELISLGLIETEWNGQEGYTPDILRLTPSQYLWRLELENILDEQRDTLIGQFGGASEYVEELIAGSTDTSVSRTAFYEALDYTVTRWSPGRGDRYMIEILRSYTPEQGYIKLIEKLRAPYNSSEGVSRQNSFPSASLRLQALQVLGRYFPAPPLAREDPPSPLSIINATNFTTYRSILNAHLDYPGFHNYVTTTLKALDPVDIPASATLPRSSSASFPLLYKRALIEDAADQFIRELEFNGATVVIDSDAITINGSRESIRPDPSDLYAKHYEVFVKTNAFRKTIAKRVATFV